MSTGPAATPVAPPAVLARPAPAVAASLPARWLLRARSVGMPVRALVASRVLVLLAGIAGSLLVTNRASEATNAQTDRLGAVGNLLAASVDRFDSSYYLGIAAHGYGSVSSRRIAFFPVYPALIRVVTVFTRSAVVSGSLISVVAFLVALTLLHRLTEAELGRGAADATILLLCFAPLSFFFSAIYTESLFLALTVGAFYAARQDRWRLACALAALATLTRPTGIVLVGPLLVLWWRGHRRLGRELGWMALVPAVLVGWMVVLSLMGYGLMGEFHIEHAVWERMTTTPLEGLALSLLAMLKGLTYVIGGGTIYHAGATGPFRPYAQDVILGAILIGCLIGLEACRRRMRPEYFVYAALVLLMCLSTPERGEPLWSFDRFALTIFPLWMAAGAFVAKRRLQVPLAILGAVALVFYTMQFASWSFVA